MIKVYASIASVGFLVLATGACSSANTPDDESDGGSSSVGSSAGTNSSAGMTVVPTAGTGSDGGTGNTSAGTGNSDAGTPPTAGTGSGGTPPVAGAACKSIKTGMACTPEGQDCPMLACGLADSGIRDCLCQGTWMCQSCDFTASPFKDKPADITTCTNQADKLDCTGQEGAVCEGAAGGEVCACWPDDEGALIWDCDKAPTSWAVPAAM
jgi:hypothetical protein